MSARIPLFSSARHPARDAAIGCAVVLAVALGVGRFAFTPLLPMMLASGAIDIRHGGWLASLNYAGYFIGAVTCAAISHDHAKVVRAGLATTVVLTFAMGLTDAFWLWAAVRFVAGAVSAWTFVFASQWGLRRLTELGASAWAGVIYTGPGVGIIVTGLIGAAAASLNANAVWIGFAALSAVACAFVWRIFRSDPRDAAPSARPREPERAAVSTRRAEAAWLIVLYGLPGFGYIITATFLPVIARHALPGSAWPDLFWPVFGAALVVGALCASRLPLHWDNRALLAGSYVLQAVGIALGIVFPTTAGFALGSVLIGLPFTAITLFAMREARRLRGERAAGLMGYATAAYGLGQIAGPLVAAPIAAHTGSFSIALWLAAGALVVGSVGLLGVAARHRKP
jgi:predicted MFS family arabinose efflux permease